MGNSIGLRLREERKRLRLTQEDFGRLGGVGRTTQINYENGDRQPDAEYLTRITGAGADIKYLIANERDKALPSVDRSRITDLLEKTNNAARLLIEAHQALAAIRAQLDRAAPTLTQLTTGISQEPNQ